MQTAAAGYAHTVAVKSDGTLWVWGDNDAGGLAAGAGGSIVEPVQIGTGFVTASAGEVHSVALKGDGTLWRWGGKIGMTGVTDLSQYFVPTLSPVGSAWSAPRPGRFTSSHGRRTGRSGHGAGTELRPAWRWLHDPSHEPVLVGSNFVSASAGGRHSVAVKADGTLWAWGSNYEGQLGTGTTLYAPVPVQVGTGYASVAAGAAHTIARAIDGSLWGFGSNPIPGSSAHLRTFSSRRRSAESVPWDRTAPRRWVERPGAPHDAAGLPVSPRRGSQETRRR